MGLSSSEHGSIRKSLQVICRRGILSMIRSMPKSWSLDDRFSYAWKSILMLAGIQSIGIRDDSNAEEILENMYRNNFMSKTEEYPFQHQLLFADSADKIPHACILTGFKSLSCKNFMNEITFAKNGRFVSPWSMVLPEDIGSIYEMILEINPHEIEEDIQLIPRTERKSKGAVHTPVDLVKHQVISALKESKIAAPNMGSQIIGCDLGNGSGAYTLAFARQVAKQHRLEINEVLKSNVIGFDIDKDVLGVAAFCFHLEARCPSDPVTYNLYQINSLEGEKARNFISSKINSMQQGKITTRVVYIGNPPYGRVKNIEYEEYGFDSLKCGNPAAYFLEQAIRIANDMDIVCQVVPISIVHSMSKISIRKFMHKHCSSIKIRTFDVVPGYMFEQGKSTSSSSNSITIRVAILTMTVGKPLMTLMTSKYVRWDSSEREEIFDSPLIRLRKQNYKEFQWPKIGSQKEKQIFEKVTQNEKTVGSLMNSDGSLKLYVAKSPRYFISAVHIDLERGQHTIGFESSFDRDVAQTIICSDLYYWYWRTTEGEYSLTKKCLENMPIPPRNSLMEHESEIKRLGRKIRSKKMMESCYKPKENKGKKNNYKFDKNPKLMGELNELMNKIYSLEGSYHFHAEKSHSIAEYDEIEKTGLRPSSFSI